MVLVLTCEYPTPTNRLRIVFPAALNGLQAEDVVPYLIGIEKRLMRKAKRGKLETSEESTCKTTSSLPLLGELWSQPVASRDNGTSLI